MLAVVFGVASALVPMVLLRLSFALLVPLLLLPVAARRWLDCALLGCVGGVQLGDRRSFLLEGKRLPSSLVVLLGGVGRRTSSRGSVQCFFCLESRWLCWWVVSSFFGWRGLTGRVIDGDQVVPIGGTSSSCGGWGSWGTSSRSGGRLVLGRVVADHAAFHLPIQALGKRFDAGPTSVTQAG